MKRIIYNAIAVAAFAVFVIVLIMDNILYATTPVVSEEGSFAYKYATRHNIPTGELPDTMKDALDWRYETFEYNSTSDGLMLTKYNGISDKLIVPNSINNEKVKGIEETLFDNPDIKSIYLSDQIEISNVKPKDTILFISSSDSRIENLKSEGWKVETYDDSESPNFNLGTIPFEYNETESSVNLTLYTGEEDILVVPSHVDGKPVTDVSFSMLNRFSLVVLPGTLTSISGTLAKTIYTPLFAIELCFTVIAFILSMIVLNVKRPKLQEADEVVLTGPQVVITELYLVAQIVFATVTIKQGSMNPTVAFIVSSVLLLLEVVFVCLAGTGRSRVKKMDQQIKESTEFMDNLKLSTADLASGITNSQVRKAVAEVVDEIQYSSPVSKDSVKPIEEKIKDNVSKLKEAINNGNDSEIIELSKEIVKAVKERNHIIKG